MCLVLGSPMATPYYDDFYLHSLERGQLRCYCSVCVCGGGWGGSWEADRVEVRGERAMKVLAGNTTVCWSTGSPGGVPSWEAWSLRVSMGPREEA